MEQFLRNDTIFPDSLKYTTKKEERFLVVEVSA